MSSPSTWSNTIVPSTNTSAEPRGKFVTFEGIDGAGKSTHLSFVADLMRGAGRRVVQTREPGGTPLGEKLRAIVLTEPMQPETETLLMFAARREHIATVIEPALARGDWVISDRFTDASYAYQGGGRGVAYEKLQLLENWVQGALQPDLTFLFDLDTAAAKERQTKAGLIPDRFEQQQADFFTAVRSVYLDRARRFPQRIRLIDASKPIEAIQAVLREIVSSI
jgi:dTMP kinase